MKTVVGSILINDVDGYVVAKIGKTATGWYLRGSIDHARKALELLRANTPKRCETPILSPACRTRRRANVDGDRRKLDGTQRKRSRRNRSPKETIA